jgi:CBS domain-containing protein
MTDPQKAPPGGPGPAPSFAEARVGDAMSTRIQACDPDLALRGVAEIMAGARVHGVVVHLPGKSGREDWRIVSDLDVVAAAEDLAHRTAGDVAGRPAAAVALDEPLSSAARQMGRERIAHLVVLDSAGSPVGILSSLDVVRALAWGQPHRSDGPAAGTGALAR